MAPSLARPHPYHHDPEMAIPASLHAHVVNGKQEGYAALALSVPLMRKTKGFPNVPPHFTQRAYLYLIDPNWVIPLGS